MFVSNLTGLLMKVEEDSFTRYRFEVWFDYTRYAINILAEGSMVAVPNFAGNDVEVHYSILEITGVLPIHYALGTDSSGYPGFVVEAARNAGQDWMTQDNDSTEDTTKIRCIAVPTNLEIVENPLISNVTTPQIQEESNLPMVGHSARLLDTAMTERVANLSLDLERDNVIQIGTLVRDPEVQTYLSVEDLIKVHFGIFGFTGAGKSNLLSTLIRKLMTESQDPVKIIIFDLMSEYTALLLDLLVEMDGARIINLGTQTVPESVLRHLNDRRNPSLLEQAAQDFLRSTVLPKSLKRCQDDLLPAFRELFVRWKVWMWQARQKTVGEFIESIRGDVLKGNLGNCKADVVKFVNTLAKEYAQKDFNEQTSGEIEKKIEDLGNIAKLSTTASNNLMNFQRQLEIEASKTQDAIPQKAIVTIPKIIEKLNDANGHSLLIIQSHNPDELREFASAIGNFTYESRRRSGQITPLASFVFDEADEFIPGQASGDSYKASKAVAMTLARRGRKFGLGIGIATQRIAHLDANTLAQPHTYFISKLPRQYDRQTIASAFGISEDMFRQTFKFKKGDWLLASYDAAGLEAIPIPIHTENAEERIFQFLDRISETYVG
ncbi:MAG: ATP-binding protein [Anaerolineae bacterium]|nr:ATP-binding protein [Anaerolineae bacterium]